MTKADIIEGVYEKVGFSKKESAEIVELVFDTVKETLERGDKIKSPGSGTSRCARRRRGWVETRRPARRSRSPRGAC